MNKFIKYILIIILSISQVYANNTIFKDLQNAKKLYNNHKYKIAYEKFLKLSNEFPENPEVNFFLGRCALELKKYDEAMAAFDRVLIINPNHTRTKLEIARLYYETNQFDLALTQINLVLKENIPQKVKENILKFKASIEKKRKRNFITANISLGFGYDSNANNDIGETNFIIPSLNIPVEGNPKESDTSLFINTSISDLYYFKNQNRWSISTTATAYLKRNKKFSKNNTNYFGLKVSPAYNNKRLKISFPIYFDKAYLDNKSYSHSLNGGIQAIYLLNPTSSFSLSSNIKRTYNDKDENQDNIEKSIKILYKTILNSKNTTILNVSYRYSKIDEIKEIRTDITSNTYIYNIGISSQFTNKLNGSLGFQKFYRNYNDIDTLFLTKRKDNQNRYNINLNYNLNRNSIIGVSLSYINNKSNQEPFIYDKTTLNLYFTKSF